MFVCTPHYRFIIIDSGSVSRDVFPSLPRPETPEHPRQSRQSDGELRFRIGKPVVPSPETANGGNLINGSTACCSVISSNIVKTFFH